MYVSRDLVGPHEVSKETQDVLVLFVVSHVLDCSQLELWAHDEGRSARKTIYTSYCIYLLLNRNIEILPPSSGIAAYLRPYLPLVAGRSTRDTTDSLPQSMLTQGKRGKQVMIFVLAFANRVPLSCTSRVAVLVRSSTEAHTYTYPRCCLFADATLSQRMLDFSGWWHVFSV